MREARSIIMNDLKSAISLGGIGTLFGVVINYVIGSIVGAGHIASLLDFANNPSLQTMYFVSVWDIYVYASFIGLLIGVTILHRYGKTKYYQFLAIITCVGWFIWGLLFWSQIQPTAFENVVAKHYILTITALGVFSAWSTFATVRQVFSEIEHFIA